MQTVKGPFYLYLLMWEINELPLRAEKLNTCDAKMGNGIEKRLEKSRQNKNWLERLKTNKQTNK